ncbi:MAG: nucleotidyltransferase domain-containing protein [Halanaerobiales bacterium]|nr:nucleotidyltransferase domain-containing protein [Halanaerobiales bacterium]
MTIQEFINFVLEKIISFYHPEKVYLFGSQARGDATKDSDIDFLIVNNSTVPKRQRALKFRKTLRGNYMYPVDILIYTPTEFQTEQEIKGTIAYHATKEGTLIYGSQTSKSN